MKDTKNTSSSTEAIADRVRRDKHVTSTKDEKDRTLTDAGRQEDEGTVTNNTANTAIYTEQIVGSVGCVEVTTHTHTHPHTKNARL